MAAACWSKCASIPAAQRDTRVHVKADRVLHSEGPVICPSLLLQKPARPLATVNRKASAAQACWRPTVRQQRNIVQQAGNGQHLCVLLQRIPLREQCRPRPRPQAVPTQPDRHGLLQQFQRTGDRRRVGQFDAIGLQATPALPHVVRHGATALPLQPQVGDHSLHGKPALLRHRQASAVGASPGGRSQHRVAEATRRIEGRSHGFVCVWLRFVSKTRTTRNGGTITKLRSNRKMPSRGNPRSIHTCR